MGKLAASDVPHPLCTANSEDGCKHDEAGAEEVEAESAVGIVPQECHEEAKAHKDHDRHLHNYILRYTFFY